MFQDLYPDLEILLLILSPLISEKSCCKSLPGQLTVTEFNIEKVLVHAASLLASEGVEYDTDEETKGTIDLGPPTAMCY
jgi:hypothetical protein